MLIHRGLSLLLLLVVVSALHAGDWPQILGPNRDGHADGEKLAEKWPAAGLKPAWTYSLGSGYAGPAIVGKQVIVFHRRDDEEIVESVDLTTGKLIWRTAFLATYRGGIDSDTGPRCVPVVAGDSVYVFGAAGDLHCVDLTNGKERWSRSLFADYGGDENYFGAGSTPLVIGDRVICNVGGNKAGLVGVDAKTGKTVWQGTEEGTSYSSPTTVTIAGKPQALFVTRLNALLVDPVTGTTSKLLPFGARGPTVNAATPLVFDGTVFLTASYNIDAVLATIQSPAEVRWHDGDTLSSQYVTPIYHKGYLYGIHGREDSNTPGAFRCIEAKTGKLAWEKPSFGIAHLILAGDKILLAKLNGELILAAADSTAYRELGRASIAADKTRAIPALSQGCFFTRTTENGQGKLICVRVGE
ncbi:outer membrane biogenesis protein BamB [Anatilimnocola aggregata]|uniref:Outer membrane biogenesis protein BamB n=1 Tax=Anatilimnocola aggregata TaxID=2528021 RepID=A0A517YLS0_9BACT|nr:PQQ-binding-like beta-propeller repeat protein [Anatilimnocola aggregata]QDU31163.1 outer membrane biogenesis protein BamB [Anatilimnocola aggregata]